MLSSRNPTCWKRVLSIQIRQVSESFLVSDKVIQVEIARYKRSQTFAILTLFSSLKSITMAAAQNTQNKTTAPPKDNASLNRKYERGIVPFGCTIA